MTAYSFARWGAMLLASACFVSLTASAQTMSNSSMSKQSMPMMSKEADTAAQHAGLAAKATELKAVQQHLHHVVNCLVGPQGAGFDASFGNPCNGQGSGAIPASTMTQRKPLENALMQAQDGIKQSNLSMAQMQAVSAQNAIMHPNWKSSMRASSKKQPAMGAMNHPM